MVVIKFRPFAHNLLVNSFNSLLMFHNLSGVSVVLPLSRTSFDCKDLPFRLLALGLLAFLAKLASSAATLLPLIRFNCIED